jgi:hypothetical protein
MKIHLKLNGQVIPATLADNRTAQEFVAMLPMTLTMHDLFRREKFGALPAPISGRGTRTLSYEVGDMVCWAPGPDLTIFYRDDGQPVSGGLHLLGRIDSGIEAFCAAGPLQVTIELPASHVTRPGASCGRMFGSTPDPRCGAHGRFA